MNPNRLWEQYRNHLCDDLQHYHQNPNTIPHIPDPTQEQIFDYGLHLIADALQRCGKSIQDFDMPRPQMNWGVHRGNQLINKQMAFNVPQLQEFVQRCQATLNVEQRNFYQAVLDSVRNTTGIMFFLQSGGGCGKTYISNLIASAIHSNGQIVLCVASTGIASLLLPGGHTAHSCFKIPIPCHEQSVCNIKKDNLTHKLLQRTSLIIWDEAASQDHHVVESVDHTLRDLLNQDRPFGGITSLFSGDFKQTLPIIQHGTRAQIVPVTLTYSNLWTQMRVHQLLQNMHLGQDPESDDWAQQLLHIGNTDEEVELPQYMHCGDGMASLINAMYSDLLALQPHQHLPDNCYVKHTRRPLY